VDWARVEESLEKWPLKWDEYLSIFAKEGLIKSAKISSGAKPH